MINRLNSNAFLKTSEDRTLNLKSMMNYYKRKERVFPDLNLNVDGMYKEILTTTPYRIPKSYIQWSELAQIITSAIINFAEISDLGLKEVDYIRTYNYAKLAKHWWSNLSPLFIVDKDLLDIILQSKILDYIDSDFVDKLLQNISNTYPSILFLFPNSSVFDGEVNYIDHCFVCLDIDKVVYTVECEGEIIKDEINIKSEGIFWGTLAKNNDVIADHLGVARENNPYFKVSGACNNLDLAEVAIQCLLLLNSKPDLFINISEGEINSINKKYNKGFSVVDKNINTKKVIYPRVLNLEYAESKIRDDDKNTTGLNKEPTKPGTPKRPHWRLGYEAYRPVGKVKGIPKEQREYKRIKVAPYFVVGNKV